MDIKFLEPFRRIPRKENKSKLIDPNTELYDFLEKYRQNIIKYSGVVVADKLMDYHIQILNRFESNNIQLFLNRVRYLSQFNIDINDINNYGFVGKAFVLFTPRIPNYGRTHITIAYFQYKPADILHLINLNPINFKIDGYQPQVTFEKSNGKPEKVTFESNPGILTNARGLDLTKEE